MSGQLCAHIDCKAITTSSPFCPEHLAAKYGVEVKESLLPNAGKGLFATQDFKRNQRITPYEGERFAAPMWGDYVLEYKKDSFVDCGWTPHCCAGRFVNDGRQPKLINCKFVYDKKQDCVWIVSTKHVYKGQEFYLNYGKNSYWKAKH